jgi:ABC-type glycerol-3-phosphate transport system permease component
MRRAAAPSGGRVLAGAALVAGLAAIAFPLGWALLASLAPEGSVHESGRLVPRELGTEHYAALFRERDFWTPVRNSLIVAGTTTAFCVVVGSACAYAVARLHFRGRSIVLAMMLVGSLFPQVALVSPLFQLLRALGLIDTHPGLILPYVTFAMPLAVWLLTTTFRQLPADVEEAAMIDGASRLRVLGEIVLPLALPGIATAAVLTFIYCWNEFLFALSFTTRPERQTVPVAVALFRGQYQVPWGQVLAATVVSTAPVVVLVALFQRRLVSGLAAGAIK